MRLELLGMGLFGFGYLCPLALYWVFRESVSALDIYWLMNCFWVLYLSLSFWKEFNPDMRNACIHPFMVCASAPLE